MTNDCNKSVQDGQAAVERIRKPLAWERRQGYLDRAVAGGLEPFVARWAPEWAGEFRGYAGWGVEARKEAVEKALRALGEEKTVPEAFRGTAGAVLEAPEATVGTAVPGSQAKGAARAPEKKAVAPTEEAGLAPEDPVTVLPALGPKRGAALRALGIQSVGDLLLHTPRDWQDRSRLKSVAELQDGELATVQVRVLSSVNFRTRNRMTITEVGLQDATGALCAVYFNQPFQQRRFQPGALVVLSGRMELRNRRRQMSNPEAEALPEGGDEALVHTGRIVPLYSLGKELSQRIFRSAVWQALPALERMAEPLPKGLREARAFPGLAEALRRLHFPESLADLEPSRRRMAFQELLLLSLALAQKKLKEAERSAPRFGEGDLPERLLAALPFTLTGAQEKVWREIRADLGKPKPMRRLLQGDVGSGKTVVSALALAAAVGAGWQGAIMAPTEILAEQHLKTLRRLLEPLGVEVLSLTQAQKGKGRKEVLAHLASGQPLVAVGTQALIQKGVTFGKLGLVVVDEQHRFGVVQRLTLARKGQDEPHSLVMTATPIPRTLAMTVYGDLDVSVLDGLPPGRSPVETRWVPDGKRSEVWSFVHRQITEGRQAYVVVPLVDESDKAEWKAATQMVEELRLDVFPGMRVELLHGRLKQEEKEAVMEAFTSGAAPVLCATTVVEVGVDVPNASVMVVEDADRFGLAQLHQLRGRVGRGAARSYCFLLGHPKTDEGRKRLEVMVSTTDGFVIAEEDLQLRGPGEVLGTRQSGLPELKYADLVRDQALVADARQAAHEIVAVDPELKARGHEALRTAVAAGFTARLELGNA
jgi:ATP-dependent DNA helicase RecG